MRDFIAVTGIGRGHCAHALSPRFCLTDYFIYGHRVCIYIYIFTGGRVGRRHGCVRGAEHQRVRLQNYSPARRSDSIKTPGARLLNRPPSVGVSDHTLEFAWKKEGNVEARR